MAAEQKLITVAEVADALGIPGQISAVREGLISDGLTIVEDWAGRDAVAFEDAKRTLDRHRKQEAEWKERRDREMNDQHEAHLCQLEFDEVAGRALPLLRKADPHSHSHEAEMKRTQDARVLAFEAVKGKYSEQALQKLAIKPISTIEEDFSVAPIRLVPIMDSSDLDPIEVAKGQFPSRAESALQRVKSMLGVGK